jgi:putative transposase
MKLSNKNIEQICYRFERNNFGKELLSKQFNVSIRRIEQILKQFKENNQIPKLKKVGRPKAIMEPATKQLIKDVYLSHKQNAIYLSYILERDFKLKVSKNKIHLVLKEFGLAKSDRKKAKPRKRVRYERNHTNSLWHADWHYLDNGSYLIAFIDDASRKVFSLEYSHMTTENSIDAFKKAFDFFGSKPKELMTDNGTQFKQLKFNKKNDCNHPFMIFCKENNIKQIFTRASRPQTNGKIERWFGTYELKRPLFETHLEFQNWYNNALHGNLGWKYAKFESPNEAFTRKMLPEDIFTKYQQKVFN